MMRSSGYVYHIDKYRPAFEWILKVTPKTNTTEQVQHTEPMLMFISSLLDVTRALKSLLPVIILKAWMNTVLQSSFLRLEMTRKL